MPYKLSCYRCGFEHLESEKCPRCRNMAWFAGAMMAGGILGLTMLFSQLAGCQPQPTVASPLDREILKRTDVQIRAIQADFQAKYAQITEPILKEQGDVKARVCGQARLAVNDCVIDLVTGAVTKAPAKPEAKK